MSLQWCLDNSQSVTDPLVPRRPAFSWERVTALASRGDDIRAAVIRRLRRLLESKRFRSRGNRLLSPALGDDELLGQ
jgi:hypothetical protein